MRCPHCKSQLVGGSGPVKGFQYVVICPVCGSSFEPDTNQHSESPSGGKAFVFLIILVLGVVLFFVYRKFS